MPPRLTSVQIWDKLEAKGLASGVRPPDTSERKRRRQEESIMQRKVVRWWEQSHEALGMTRNALISIPNGGHRTAVTAAIMKAEGQVPGAVDMFLFSARNNYHGLGIEMKSTAGRVMPKQEKFHEMLMAAGYKVIVCRSMDEAVEGIKSYLR